MNGLAGMLAIALPDDPEWIDIRGMLLSGHAVVTGDATVADGFVIRVAHRSLSVMGVVGHPNVDSIRSAAAEVGALTPLVAQLDNAAHVHRALPDWPAERAVAHTLAPGATVEAGAYDGVARLLGRDEQHLLADVPSVLHHELTQALAFLPIAAVFVDQRPVSFCYPVWRTERWWDVSIDTLEAYRGRGLGAAAVRLMIDHMRAVGREPVWGALESNSASRRLAAKLGFVPVGEIMVFLRADHWTVFGS